MNINYLPCEVCIILKEIGFDKETDAMYEISLTESIDPETEDTTGPFGWKKGEVNFVKRYFANNHPSIDFSNENWLLVSAPLIQQVFRWFRKEFGIYTNIMCVNTQNNTFKYEVIKDNEILFDDLGMFEHQEEFEIECIKKVIRYLKNNI